MQILPPLQIPTRSWAWFSGDREPGLDVGKDRLTEKAWLGYIVHGAALAQLLAEGCLVDTGAAVTRNGHQHSADTVLQHVLNGLPQAKPRTWKRSMHQSDDTLRAVQDQLIQTGVIQVKGKRAVAVVDRDAVAELQAQVSELTRGYTDVAQVRVLDAVLVVLAAIIPLTTVLTRHGWRQRRERVTALASRVNDDGPGFDNLISQMRRTRRLAYSAGGPVH